MPPLQFHDGITMAEELKVIGKNLPRKDAIKKANGTAQFTVDIKLPGMLYGKCLRSPYAHARIVSIDTSKAEALPGVKAVLTHKDIAPKNTFKQFKDRVSFDIYVLEDKVRYTGDEVAAVAAISEEIAEEALNLIQVEYEELPAVFSAEEALKPDAPKIHPEGNLVPMAPGRPFTYSRQVGDVEKGFSEADLILERRYTTHMQSHCPLETRTCIADWDSTGKVTLWDSTQKPFEIHVELANVLGLSLNKLRVITLYVGGAFGSKETLLKIHGIAAFLSKKAGRPVKIELSREEQAVTGTRRHSWTFYIKVGAKKDGTLTAYYNKAFLNAGPYVFLSIMVALNQGSLTPKFSCPNRKYDCYVAYTNCPPASAFRGFGYLEGDFAICSIMEELCEKLGIDPLDFYLKNHLRNMEPYGMYNHPRSLAFGEAIQKSAEKIRWKEKRHSPGEQTLTDGRKHGIGMGISGGNAALLQSTAVVMVDDRGSVTLLSGAVEQGQGAHSEMPQIVAEALGVPYDDVEIVGSDTGMTPYDSGQDASRTTLTHGNAVKMAAEDARQQLLSHAALRMKVSPQDLDCKEGIVFARNNPDRKMSVADVVQQLMVDFPPAVMPRKAIIGKGSYFIPGYPPPAGNAVCNIAEVEVDTTTGQIELTRFISAVDCGKAISPKGIEGQYESVLSAGAGFALKEELLLEPGTGKVLNPSFLDYNIPTSLDYCNMDPVIIVESMEKLGPYGAKGIGECALSAAAPAISNAIYNAIGVRVSLPAMPDKVLAALGK